MTRATARTLQKFFGKNSWQILEKTERNDQNTQLQDIAKRNGEAW